MGCEDELRDEEELREFDLLFTWSRFTRVVVRDEPLTFPLLRLLLELQYEPLLLRRLLEEPWLTLNDVPCERLPL